MDIDALYDAAIAGDADAIAKLEAEADKLNERGETILHVESINGNTERVRFILRQFASKNLLIKLGWQGETALAWPAYFGYTEVVEALIDAARQLPSSLAYNSSQLRMKLDNLTEVVKAPNHVSSFQAFLRHADKDLDTALNVAARTGHTTIAKLLIEADPSDKHIQNKDGKTPIYIAAENGYHDIVKLICTTCTSPLNFEGPGGSTALHAAIKNLDRAKEEDKDVIRVMINAAKCSNIPEDKSFANLFNKVDENRQTILELAVEGNHAEVIELILAENPAYVYGGGNFIGLVPLIYKASDKKYWDCVKLLTESYQAGAANSTNHVYRYVDSLISAIRSGNEDSVLGMVLVVYCDHRHINFADDMGWSLLHHAAYHQFDSILDVLVAAQKRFGCPFVYDDRVQTPFHVAAEKGHASTVILLMELWPFRSTSVITAVNNKGENILHIAALRSDKEMIQRILNYCPQKYINEIVNKQDDNGNTPLHLLISHGCFIPELIKYKGLDIMVRNKEDLAPLDHFYTEEEIIADQALIKIMLDDIHTDQYWKFGVKATRGNQTTGKVDGSRVNERQRMRNM